MDATVETRVVENIVRLLEDSAKEVQDVAVKALAPLVRKVSEAHVTSIINALAQNVANDARGKAEIREVANSGLKAVLRGVGDELGDKVSKLLCPLLIAAVKKDKPDITQECLDIINDLLARFGHNTGPEFIQQFEQITLPLLDNSRNLIKQRAIWVLTNVSKHCKEDAFKHLSEQLTKKMQTDIKKQGTAIQLVGSLARNVGFRMGKFVDSFVPLLVNAVKNSKADGDEDIKENAFQTFGSFVEDCPRATKPHIGTILDLCVKFLSWDPNALEDDDGSGGGSGDEGSGDEGSGDEASEDEDDKTWMVRRAAAKTINGIVVVHPEMLEACCTKAAAALAKQFKERESTARVEILGAYSSLAHALHQVGDANAPALTAFSGSLGDACTSLALLLAHKSADTRIAACVALRTLASNLPGSLDQHLGKLVKGIASCITDRNVQLRIAALELVTQILRSHSSDNKKVEETLLKADDPIFKGLQKVLAEKGLSSRLASVALTSCEAYLEFAAGNFNFMIGVYKAFEPLYKQTDLDSEAKESAIRAAARAVCNIGVKLPNAGATLDVLVERLGAELTREAATIAVGQIASDGPQGLPDGWLTKAVPLLGQFAGGAAPRTLKIAALTSLARVMENSGFGSLIKTHDQVLEAVAPLIDAEDVSLAQLAIEVVDHTIHTNPKCVANIKKSVYPKVLTVIPSPLLEGSALGAMAQFFSELVKLDTKGLGYAELAKDLDGLFKGASADQTHVFRNVGTCYAQVIVGDTTRKHARETIDALVKRARGTVETDRLSAIYTLAEVGRAHDISEFSAGQASSSVVDVLSAALDSDSRPVALAASYALGCVAIGNLPVFLPVLVGDMKKHPKRQLLLLQSIKEIVSGQQAAGGAGSSLRVSLSASIGGSAGSDIAEHLDTLLPILFEHSSSSDELTRNAVAECLGRLAKIATDRILPKLKESSKGSNANARNTTLSALRCAVSGRPLPDLDRQLTEAYGACVDGVVDADIGVRLSALQALSWALQTKASIAKPHLAKAMKGIVQETVVDTSLQKITELGQVKHVDDAGLPKRTAAFELLYLILERGFECVAVDDYVEPIARGLDDILSIKELSYKMLRRLAQVAGGQVFAHLDKWLPRMEKEIKATIPKAEPFDRFITMKKAAFR